MFADAEANGAPATVPTVRTFAPAFLADCAERWKPATREAHANDMKRHHLQKSIRETKARAKVSRIADSGGLRRRRMNRQDRMLAKMLEAHG